MMALTTTVTPLIHSDRAMQKRHRPPMAPKPFISGSSPRHAPSALTPSSGFRTPSPATLKTKSACRASRTTTPPTTPPTRTPTMTTSSAGGAESQSALSSFLRTLVNDRTVTVLEDNHRTPVPTPEHSPKTTQLKVTQDQQLKQLQHMFLTPPRRVNSKLACISGPSGSVRSQRHRSPSPPTRLPLFNRSPSPTTSPSSVSLMDAPEVLAATTKTNMTANTKEVTQSTSAVLLSLPLASSSSCSNKTKRSTRYSRSTRSRTPSPAPSAALHRDSRWDPDSSLNWSTSSLDTSCLDNLRMEYSKPKSRSSFDDCMSFETFQRRHIPLPPTRQFNPDSPSMMLGTRKQHSDDLCVSSETPQQARESPRMTRSGTGGRNQPGIPLAPRQHGRKHV